MEQDLRTRLDDELAAAPEPPIGDLVGGAVRRGKRLRVWRRLRTGGAAVAVLAVLAGGASFARGAGDEPDAQVAAPVNLVPASPAGLLQLLLDTLPPGATSHYAADPAQPMIQVYLDRGNGPGMLRVAVSRAAGGTERTTVSELPDNCVQRTIVTGYHADGLLVQVNVASCLAWDGTQNAPAAQALTVEEARAVAADPRWGLRIDESIETAGAARFAQLPAIE
ncbi:hypothetical protein [Dactylosporangium sp. CS-033363]|uniref:hypothetical protein n=1 Tax=Dactylosporangium sp. CS-033363 TaxID=3239935 RepID=UPI003D93D749